MSTEQDKKEELTELQKQINEAYKTEDYDGDKTIYKYKGHTIKVWHDQDTESPREWNTLGSLKMYSRSFEHLTDSNQQSDIVEEYEAYGDRNCMDVEEFENYVFNGELSSDLETEALDKYNSWRLDELQDILNTSSLDKLSRQNDTYKTIEFLTDKKLQNDLLTEAIEDATGLSFITPFGTFGIEEREGRKDWSERFECLPVYVMEHGSIAFSTGSFGCPWDSGRCGVIYVTHERIAKEYGVLTDATIEKARKVLEAEIELFSKWANGETYGYSVEDSEGNNIDSCGGFYGYEHCENGVLESAVSAIEYELNKTDK